jgi:hypothetical protein
MTVAARTPSYDTAWPCRSQGSGDYHTTVTPPPTCFPNSMRRHTFLDAPATKISDERLIPGL